jgi:hypothetical protein
MKHSLTYCSALTLLAVALTGCRPQPTPTLKGQSLGETFSAFVAKSPDLQRIIRTCKDCYRPNAPMLVN